MLEADVTIRNLTYGTFVDLGLAPTASEVAARLSLAPDDVVVAWRRLHEAHALVLDEDRTTLRMANPFSAVPTPYRVAAAGRSWYANCAWDAIGICAALHVDGYVETTCQDCGGSITVEIRDERPDDETLVFHALVPAAHWWDDIVFT